MWYLAVSLTSHSSPWMPKPILGFLAPLNASVSIMKTLQTSLVLIFSICIGTSLNAEQVKNIVNDSKLDSIERVTIGSLFDDPHRFEGRHVKMIGAAGDQDPRGYWLYLDAPDARIYIETPSGISSLVGETIRVTGDVVVMHGIPSIVATSIEKR